MLSDLGTFEVTFWRDEGTCVAGQNITRAELWMNVIRVLPWARGMSLAEDFTAHFIAALSSENLEEMYAILDLLRLRTHYWQIMHGAGWNFAHVNLIEIEAMKVFYTKISDRLDQTQVGSISAAGIRPSVFPSKVRHVWQH